MATHYTITCPVKGKDDKIRYPRVGYRSSKTTTGRQARCSTRSSLRTSPVGATEHGRLHAGSPDGDAPIGRLSGRKGGDDSFPPRPDAAPSPALQVKRGFAPASFKGKVPSTKSRRMRAALERSPYYPRQRSIPEDRLARMSRTF